MICLLPLSSAFAGQQGNYAWEVVLLNMTKSLTGPVAYAIAIMAIVGCGLTMAVADLQGGAKRFVQAGCGLSVEFFAASIVTSFLRFNGALV